MRTLVLIALVLVAFGVIPARGQMTVPVSNETELRQALCNPTPGDTIQFTTNITLTSNLDPIASGIVIQSNTSLRQLNLQEGGALTFSPTAGVSQTFDNLALLEVCPGITASLVKNGAGTLNFTGQNRLEGGLFLNGGLFVADRDEALGFGTVDFNGGALQIAGGNSNVGLTFVLEAGGGTIDTPAGTVTGLNGFVVGSGTLTKTGDGVLVFGKANTYTGDTLVTAGTLRLIKNANLACSALRVDAGATFESNVASAAAVAISGAGCIILGGGSLTAGDGTDRTFSGVISGGGGFIKTGSGLLTLSGANTHLGGTTVQGGTLNLLGSLGSSLTVQSGATLTGGGTLNGGNYTSSGGNFLMKVSSLSSFDHLTINSGTGSITGGTLTVVPQGGFAAPVGSRFDLITASGGVTGRFATQAGNFGPGRLYEQVVGPGGSLQLFIFSNLVSFAQTPNQAAIAAALDAAVLAGNSGLSLLTDAALAEGTGRALDRLSPEVFHVQARMVFEEAHAFVAGLEQRGGRVPPANGATQTVAGPDNAGLFGMAPVPAMATKEDPDLVNVTGYGIYVRQDTEENALGRVRTGSSFHDNGLRLTYQHRLSDGLLVGVLAAHGQSDGTFDQVGGGAMHARNTSVGPFVSYVNGGTYGDFALWRGDHRFTTSRSILLPGFSTLLNSTNDGSSTSAYLGGGHMWQRDGWTYGPTAALQYTDLTLDAFTETGGPGALTVADQSAHTFRSLLGGRISKDIPTASGRIVPELRLRWAHEFADDARIINAQFVGSPGPFAVLTASPSRDSAYLGVGINAYFHDTQAYLDYDLDTGRNGLAVHSLSGGARFKF